MGGFRDPRRRVARSPPASDDRMGNETLEKAAVGVSEEFDTLGPDEETPSWEAPSCKARYMLAEWLGVRPVE